MRQVPRKRTKVIFPFKTTPIPHRVNSVSSATTPISRSLGRNNDDIMVITMDSIQQSLQSATISGHSGVPILFTEPPVIRDPLITDSSIIQDETVEDCVPLLAGANPDNPEFVGYSSAGVPRLETDDHADFLIESLQNAKYIPYDASRPWILYWCLTGLSLLGRSITQYRQRFSFILDAL